MLITKQTVAAKLAAYLRHDVSLPQLVDWAERALMEGEFAEADASILSQVVARLGVADVRAFGLTWEDCEQLLSALGFSARVEIVAALAARGGGHPKDFRVFRQCARGVAPGGGWRMPGRSICFLTMISRTLLALFKTLATLFA